MAVVQLAKESSICLISLKVKCVDGSYEFVAIWIRSSVWRVESRSTEAYSFLDWSHWWSFDWVDCWIIGWMWLVVWLPGKRLESSQSVAVLFMRSCQVWLWVGWVHFVSWVGSVDCFVCISMSISLSPVFSWKCVWVAQRVFSVGFVCVRLQACGCKPKGPIDAPFKVKVKKCPVCPVFKDFCVLYVLYF